MIILPTIHRPESLRRFIECYKATDASLPVWVMLDHSDAAFYCDIKVPKNFRVIKVGSGTRIGDIFNLVLRHAPKEDFYGIIADDVVPETFRWDMLLREACMPDKISWGFDGGHDESLPRHPFIGGDLVRKLGFISVPGIKHWYVDNAWQDIASTLNCGVYRPEVRMVHKHFTNGQARKDRTYDEQPDHRADEIYYNIWKEQEFPKLIERLKAS